MYKILYEKAGVEQNTYVRKFMVSSETDLANLPVNTATGSVAHTVGMGDVWEKGMDGTWHEVSTGGGSITGVDYLIGSDNGLPYIQSI